MAKSRVSGVVLAGHKEAAIEVPFDPAGRFRVEAAALRAGRRGHRVRATFRMVSFETEIVPRSKRFWLVLPETALADLGAAEGDRIELEVEPIAPATPIAPAKKVPRRAAVSRRRAAPRSSSRAARRGG